MGQSVTHPVYTAALKRGMEDLRGGRTRAFVVIGDDQLDAAQAAISKERRKPFQNVSASEGPVATPSTSRRLVGVHSHSDYRCRGYDTAAVTRLHISWIDPEVGPFALKRSGKEGIHPPVDLLDQTAHLLLETPDAPMALTGSSTDRVETPWTLGRTLPPFGRKSLI
jgi:hypothetical protein